MRTASNLAFLILSGATFAALFDLFVPGPEGVEVLVLVIFAVLFVLASRSEIAWLYPFAFVVPLVGVIPNLFGSPTAPVLSLAFFGLAGGLALKGLLARNRSGPRWPEPFLPLAPLVALTVLSAIIGSLRFANFFPLTAGPYHDWILNGAGILASEALRNTLIVAINYVSGVAFLLICYRLFRRLGEGQRGAVAIRLAWTIVAAGLLANIFAVWQLFSKKFLKIGFITGTYTDSNALGVCSVVVFACSLGLMFCCRGRARVFVSFCGLLTIAVVVLARSRAGLLGIVLVTLGTLLAARKARKATAASSIAMGRPVVAFAVLAAVLVGFLVVQDITQLGKVPVIGDALLVMLRPSQDSLRYVVRHRLHQWAEALRMSRQFPWTGVGLGAYIVELPNFYLEHCRRVFTIDTAGNLFLQIASELGVLGLILLLWFVAIICRSCLRRPWLSDAARQGGSGPLLLALRITVLVSVFLFLFGAHLLFFEYNYLLGLCAGLVLASGWRLEPPMPANSRGFRRKVSVILVPLIIVVSAIFLAESLGRLSIEARRRQVGWQLVYGFYRRETWDGKFGFFWTQKEAKMCIPVRGKALVFSLFCAHPDADEKPVICSLFVDGRLERTVTLPKHKWQTVRIPFRYRIGRECTVRFVVNRTFNPRKAGLSNDGRDLGVAVAGFRWQDK